MLHFKFILVMNGAVSYTQDEKEAFAKIKFTFFLK